MNERWKLATRLAVLLLALAALGAWFALGSGGRTESASGLAISMTDAPDPVAPGGTVTYTIEVENTGTEDEDGVVVDDTLSGPATIVSAVPSQGACNPPTATSVHCALGTIGPGATTTITVAKEVPPIEIGGIAEFKRSDSAALEAPHSPGDRFRPLYALLGGAGAAMAGLAAVSAWWLRRRWVR